MARVRGAVRTAARVLDVLEGDGRMMEDDVRPAATSEAQRESGELLDEPTRGVGGRWPADGERVIVNAVSGEHIVVRTSGAQTAGRLLAFDLFLPPGGHVPARHVHPIQAEQFTVVAGRMRFTLGRRTILAGPGETVLVPAGTPHWFGNAGSGVAEARVEVRPALRTEELLEASELMAVAGRFLGARMPRPSDLALFLLEFQREIAVPDLPAFLVRAVLAPLAWVGRRRHRDAGR